MAKGMTWGRLLRDFSLWCSLVCLQKVATGGKYMAMAFAAIFLAMCLIFIGISVNLSFKFFAFPSSTEVSIDVQSAEFPRFSVCNENPMKRSVVDTNHAYSAIATLLRQYELIEQDRPTADDYGLRTTKSRLQRMRRARIMLRLLMARLTPEERYAAGYSFSQLVSECTFGAKTCTSADFTPFLHPDYNVCFAFNGERMVVKAGKMEGLRMVLTINQDINGTFEFLPTTDSAAVWGVIYDANDYPDFTKGFRVGAATQSFIGLTKSTNLRLEKPYGSCVTNDSATFDHYGNYTYSFNLCQHACLQRIASERCGCVDPLYEKDANETFCTTAENVRCLISLTNDVSDARSKEGKSLCNCSQPCAETVYDKTFTNSIFPSGKYLVALGTQQQRDELLANQGGGRRGHGSDESNDYEHGSKTTSTSTTAIGTTSSEHGTTSTTGGHETSSSTTTTTTTASTGSTTTAQPSTSTSSSTSSIQTTTTSTAGSTTTSTASTPTTTSTSSTATPTTSTTPRKPCTYPGPPASGATQTASSLHCLTDPGTAEVYKDAGVVALRGYPCTSSGSCNTCIFFTHPPSLDAFPCSYTYGMSCFEKSNKGYFPFYKCQEFFTNFSFIPLGTNVPNVIGWNNGALPGMVDPSACSSNSTSSDLSTLKNVPLDPKFVSRLNSATTPCQMVDIAIAAAEEHYGGQSTGGKRKKRDTTTASIDMPGLGSCEYANKNFNGADECIAWYKRNGLMINVYFETLKVQNYTQGSTYPLVALLSDISGHAGLWLGMSVVSVAELISLIFMCLSNLFCGNKINVADEDDIRREVDARERGRGRTKESPRE